MATSRSDSIDVVSAANGNGSAKLFIGGLSYDTTDASLTRYFESYGNVASAVVLRDPSTLRSRGFGFVTFIDANSASDVLEVQMHTIDGRKVEAKFAVPRSSSTASNSSNERANNVNGITNNENMSNNNSNRKAVRKHNKQNGGLSMYENGKNDRTKGNTNRRRQTLVNSSTIPVPGKAWNSSSDVVAETTVVNNGRTEVEEKEKAYSGKEKNGLVPNKVFVGGLLYATGNESLRHYFERYGNIKTAEVIYNRDTKKSRGFGFVVFKDFEAVQQVLSQQEQGMHVVDGKHVEVKLCVARQDETKDSKSNRNNNNNRKQLYRHSSTSSVSIESSKSSSSSVNINMETVNPWQSFAQVAAIGISTTAEIQRPPAAKLDLLETDQEPEPQSPLSTLNRNTPVFKPNNQYDYGGGGSDSFASSPPRAIQSPMSTGSAPFNMYSQAFSPIGSNQTIPWASPEQKQYASGNYGSLNHVSPLSLSAPEYVPDINNNNQCYRNSVSSNTYSENQLYSPRSHTLNIGEKNEADSIEQLGSHFSSLLSPRFVAANKTVVGDGNETAFQEYSMFT